MCFLVDDGVKWIATMRLGSCSVIVEVFGCLFDVVDAILAVDFTIEDSINNRSVHHTLWFSLGNQGRKRPLASQLVGTDSLHLSRSTGSISKSRELHPFITVTWEITQCYCESRVKFHHQNGTCGQLFFSQKTGFDYIPVV
jgi:hypothetical protein